jgi:glucose/arabinose dehydrogenase
VGTDCGTAQAETLSMPLHSTPFGLDFEPGRWPGSHAHSLFIAMHGSAGSWVGTGILEVPVDTSGAPTGTSSYFATGWGSDPDSPVEGRATDLAFAPDGRLFVIDDNSGDVWWIAPEDLPLPAGW